ncbi:hypothetical protein [Halomonas halocynthiae]|uniref:hypothetical protein n=1 Tax=Halomonas halocynthiae TaxID=176290 RepID=UPI000481B3E2|nr:hypothetical protein [Halomonas halocynthiae]
MTISSPLSALERKLHDDLVRNRIHTITNMVLELSPSADKEASLTIDAKAGTLVVKLRPEVWRTTQTGPECCFTGLDALWQLDSLARWLSERAPEVEYHPPPCLISDSKN